MPVEPRGRAIRVTAGVVNWQQAEPSGRDGRRQLSRGGTSRVTGDSHARICESRGVKFPGATRPTQKAAATRATTFTARLGRGRRRHAKRMAAVAAVYTIEPFVRTPEEIFPPAGKPATSPARPAPEHKRVWASLARPPEAVIAELFDEAQHRDPRHRKQWVALVDGNETQIELLIKQTEARHVAMPIVLDFIHVAEYVWEASRAFAADAQARDAWVLPRLREILRGNASDVAGGMRRSATLRGLAAADREPVDVCADYLLKIRPVSQIRPGPHARRPDCDGRHRRGLRTSG